MLERLLHKAFKRALKRTEDGRFHYNAVNMRMAELEHIARNVKMLGLELARRAYDETRAVPAEGPQTRAVSSKPSTQADLESPWARYWCKELKIAPILHRKVWEYCWVLQTLHDWGALRPGARGLAFGVGEEPLPSYFAARGVDVVATDLAPEEVAGRGWAETAQHAATPEHLFWPELVDRETFNARVKLQWADMTAIPASLRDFDFTWSICAFEHLGTIDRGLKFVKDSINTLKPGGVAVHTTEYNIQDGETVREGDTVLFQRQDFERLARELTDAGHEVAPLDFNLGDGLMDRYVDIPPYAAGRTWRDADPKFTADDSVHMKLSVYGFPCTCFGIAVRRGRA